MGNATSKPGCGGGFVHLPGVDEGVERVFYEEGI